MIMAGALSVTPVPPSVLYVRADDVRSLNQIILIRILLNLVTLFNTIMSSSSSIMVYIALCFQQLWPFVYEIFRFKKCPLSKLNSFDQNFMKLCHIV